MSVLRDLEDAPVAPPTPEEQRMAEDIFDALQQLAPNRFMTGDPRAGRMEIAFDGNNILDAVGGRLL